MNRINSNVLILVIITCTFLMIHRMTFSWRSNISSHNKSFYNHRDHGARKLLGGGEHNNMERCGSRNPTLSELQVAVDVVTKWNTNNLLHVNQIMSIEIDTYFHVITDGSRGKLSMEDLQHQLAVLNEAFRPNGFAFRLQGTSITDNSAWYYADWDSQEQYEMKDSLRVGDSSTLNVYFNNPYASTEILYGYASFPSDYAAYPRDDGVVLYNEVIPGGSVPQYNGGITLVHEVGHWLGLFHTFQTGDLNSTSFISRMLKLFGLLNGCNTLGDGIQDTPSQRSPSSGCPIIRNSCPFRPGLDPVHNYMEYTTHACRTEFTPNQSTRMWVMWNEYRAT